MIEDYARHAAVWDWDGYNNSAEYDYWCNYANQYGKKVLIPMCALGQAGAYMAERGFQVTAFDITKEMIKEGIKRFHAVENLNFKVADICSFDFDEKEFDFCFIATQDLHLLPDIEKVKKAFLTIAGHLRKGACFALECVLPASESYEVPRRIFYPRVPNYTDKKVYKEGWSRYDAVTKQHIIEQIVTVRDDRQTVSFPYSVTLQYFERNELIEALRCAGFSVPGEFRNRKREPWVLGCEEWFGEAIRQG